MSKSLEEMIQFDLRGRDIHDEKVLDAFRKVDRAAFIPQLDMKKAYEDQPIHLTHGQTISQPYIVAYMTQKLNLTGNEKVLEIGTGSGWQTAILAVLAKEVWTVERIEYLATTAEDRLLDLGYQNIHYHLGDGTLGLPEYAPYDRILAAAAGPKIPESWAEQLAEGGRLVAPIGTPEGQTLLIGEKKNGTLIVSEDIGCRFVLLRGKNGFDENTPNAE